MSAEFLSPETKEIIKFIASILEIIAIGGSFLIVAYRLMLPYVQNNGKFTIKWFAIQQINFMMHDIETTKKVFYSYSLFDCTSSLLRNDMDFRSNKFRNLPSVML